MTEPLAFELDGLDLLAEAVSDAVDDRDAALVKARAAGHSLAAIADAAGMSKSGVAKIIARRRRVPARRRP